MSLSAGCVCHLKYSTPPHTQRKCSTLLTERLWHKVQLMHGSVQSQHSNCSSSLPSGDWRQMAHVTRAGPQSRVVRNLIHSDTVLLSVLLCLLSLTVLLLLLLYLFPSPPPSDTLYCLIVSLVVWCGLISSLISLISIPPSQHRLMMDAGGMMHLGVPRVRWLQWSK